MVSISLYVNSKCDVTIGLLMPIFLICKNNIDILLCPSRSVELFMSECKDFETSEYIKNAKSKTVLLFVKAFLSSQIQAYQHERDIITNELESLVSNITEENDALFRDKDEIYEEIKKFKVDPAEYWKR